MRRPLDTNAQLPWFLLADLNLLPGVQVINKFGRNPSIGTASAEDIWNGGGLYTGFPEGDVETLDVFSASANDTAAGTGARTVRLFGLDANGLEQEEDVTLNGSTPVTTSLTWTRMNRARVLTAGSGGTNEGEITAQHTTTTANVMMVMPAEEGATNICAYTVPANRTGVLIGHTMDVLRGSGTGNREVDARIRVRRPGGVWTTKWNIAAAFGSPSRTSSEYIGVRLEPLSDVRVNVVSVSANNTDVEASMTIALWGAP